MTRYSSQPSAARKISVRVDPQGNREESVDQYTGVPFKIPDLPASTYTSKTTQKDLFELLKPLSSSVWLRNNELYINLLRALGGIEKTSWTPYFVSPLFAADDNHTVYQDEKYKMKVTLAGDPSSAHVSVYPFEDYPVSIRDTFVTLHDDLGGGVLGEVGRLGNLTIITIPTPTRIPTTYTAEFF